MPKLAKLVLEDSDYEYELSLNWDDEAFMKIMSSSTFKVV